MSEAKHIHHIEEIPLCHGENERTIDRSKPGMEEPNEFSGPHEFAFSGTESQNECYPKPRCSIKKTPSLLPQHSLWNNDAAFPEQDKNQPTNQPSSSAIYTINVADSLMGLTRRTVGESDRDMNLK